MKQIVMTLCFVFQGNEVLLGLKKRKSLGEGLWNGFGGHVDSKEDIDVAAKRELREESGIIGLDLKRLGFITYINETRKNKVYMYRCTKFEGKSKESGEMKPQWFHIDQVLNEEIKLWPDILIWFDNILANRKFKGKVYYNDDNTVVGTYELTTFFL